MHNVILKLTEIKNEAYKIGNMAMSYEYSQSQVHAWNPEGYDEYIEYNDYTA